MTETTLGCVSVGVSGAGGVCRVRTVRRGRCSFKTWLRQHLRGDPAEQVLPVPEPCWGAAWAGKGSRALVLCVAAIKLGLHSSTALVPSSRCKRLILSTFPKPNTSPVPLAGPLGQEGRGGRAGAEFVPWGRLWVHIRRALPAPGVSKHSIKKSQRTPRSCPTSPTGGNSLAWIGPAAGR